MDNESGIHQAGRYALQAGCGNPDDEASLRKSWVQNEDTDAREILAERGFPHLNAFLKAIAEAQGAKDPYSPEIVRAYWLGPKDNTYIMSKDLAKHYVQTMSPEFGQAIEAQLPERIVPIHLTMVALIASPEITDRNLRLAGINHCMISSARITEMQEDGKGVTVERDTLVDNEAGGFTVQRRHADVRIDRDLTPDVNIGDPVALHQGTVAEILTQEEADRLSYWTREVAKTLK